MSSGNITENYLYALAAQKQIPVSGTFELLPICNLDCKMCYVKRSVPEVKRAGGLRNADEWIELGRRAANAGMLFLLLTGGEPFLYPEFDKVYSELYKLGLVIDVNSNGTLIGPEQISWLRKEPPRHLKISLYGASGESYRRLCGDERAFEKVLRSFELLKSAGIIVYVSITVTPANFDELDSMFALCTEYKIPVKATSYMFPPLRSCKIQPDKDYRLSSEDAARATVSIVKHSNSEEAFYEKADLYTQEQFQNVRDFLDRHSECSPMTCRAGRSTFWVTWEGKMVPCAMMGLEGYPVMDTGSFSAAWKYIRDKVEKIRLPAVCTDCSSRHACYACAAACFCETGATMTRPPYVCEMTGHYMRLMKEEYIRWKESKEGNRGNEFSDW